MKKLSILASLLACSSVSLFATGASGCDNAIGSGCGAWWTNYTLGTSVDGVFAQSSGVGVAYTATYTNVAASQDPLAATFPWVATNNTALTTSTTTDSYGSLLNTVSTTTSTLTTVQSYTASTSTSSTSGGFGDIMTTASAYTASVATYVPTNTSVSTSLNLFGGTSNSSYSSFLAAVYGVAYGNQQSSGFNPNAVGNADPIVPEPGSYASMGMGLIGVAVYAYRRRKAA